MPIFIYLVNIRFMNELRYSIGHFHTTRKA